MWPEKKEVKVKVDYLVVKLLGESDARIFEMNANGDDTFDDDEDEILWVETIDGRVWHFPLRGVQYYIYSKDKPR